MLGYIERRFGSQQDANAAKFKSGYTENLITRGKIIISRIKVKSIFAFCPLRTLWWVLYSLFWSLGSTSLQAENDFGSQP